MLSGATEGNDELEYDNAKKAEEEEQLRVVHFHLFSS
jgi:hypothetical protein